MMASDKGIVVLRAFCRRFAVDESAFWTATREAASKESNHDAQGERKPPSNPENPDFGGVSDE